MCMLVGRQGWSYSEGAGLQGSGKKAEVCQGLGFSGCDLGFRVYVG